MNTWEDYISLNSSYYKIGGILSSVDKYTKLDDKKIIWDEEEINRKDAIKRDSYPLPTTEDREGYYGENHYNYWVSGLRDIQNIKKFLRKYNINYSSVLDFGCASGRILRHFLLQEKVKNVWGCDINRAHIDWICKYLPSEIKVFQNTSIPYINLPDASVDLITAFSVFTHIECFDTTWLMELHRILKVGGVAWITVHNDGVWNRMKKGWPLFDNLSEFPDFKDYINNRPKEIPEERFVFRWSSERSYSSNVFYRNSYIKKVWGRFFKILEITEIDGDFQEVVLLQKT